MSVLFWKRLSLIVCGLALLAGVLLTTEHFQSNTPPLRHLIGHCVEVTSLAFSPDNRLMATAGDSQETDLYRGEIQIWDRQSLQQQRTLVFPTGIGDHNQTAFSPDGKYLAGSNDQNITVWDVNTGNIIKNFPLFRTGKLPITWTSCFALFFRRDGALMDCEVGGDNSQIVKLWDHDASNQIWRFFNGTEIQHVLVSPDQTLIAIASFDPAWHFQVKLLNAQTGKLLRVFKPASSPLATMQAKVVCFSPDSRWLALAGPDAVTIVDMQTGRIIQTQRIECRGLEYPNALAFSPDGLRLAIGTNGQAATFLESLAENAHSFGTVSVWNLHTGKVQALPGYDGGVDALVYAPDGRVLWCNNVTAFDVTASGQ